MNPDIPKMPLIQMKQFRHIEGWVLRCDCGRCTGGVGEVGSSQVFKPFFNTIKEAMDFAMVHKLSKPVFIEAIMLIAVENVGTTKVEKKEEGILSPISALDL